MTRGGSWAISHKGLKNKEGSSSLIDEGARYDILTCHTNNQGVKLSGGEGGCWGGGLKQSDFSTEKGQINFIGLFSF